MARYLIDGYAVSQRRTCRLAKLPRKTFHYVSKRPTQGALRRRIVEVARSRVRYWYLRIHVLLKREGIHVNKKRVYRLYCLEGLQIRAKRPRRSVSAANRQPPKSMPKAPNVAWSMDFVTDQTSAGERFRALTVVEMFSRECLALKPGKSLRGEDVVRVLTELVKERGLRERIHCDNGSEFAGRLLDLWAYGNQVTLEFSRPGKPTDNALIESLNGSLRDECLNDHWFKDLTDAKQKLQAWKVDFNEGRPHSALNNLTPREFIEKWERRGQRFASQVG